ncbi:hypothetical protein PAPYR_2992 [Paratrimastix pyriformis]|uniref:HAUS augmin-like complex subunit 7 n=1 Tax=Paratrimastix pyriformis TaxID=342808 RepID=A0ABQ8UVI0_9EUKA|nr:hypothetical protein PAPYR_2992 [Paratrimastix pyriformis]
MNPTQQRLRALGCPMAFEVTEESILIPGKLRFDVIEWLFSLVDEDWKDTGQNLTENQVQKMTRFASYLGLCQSSQTDLLDGTAPPERQVTFFRTLIDFASTLIEAPEQLSTGRIQLESLHAGLNEAYHRDCDLLDCVLAQRTPLPPDAPPSDPPMAGLPAPSTQIGMFSTEPNLAKVRGTLMDLQSRHGALEEQLAKMAAQCTFTPGEDTAIAEAALAAQLGDLQQALTVFVSVYSTEFAPWMKQPDVLEGVGEAATEALPQLQAALETLENARVLRECCENLRSLAQQCPDPQKTQADIFKRQEAARIFQNAAAQLFERSPSDPSTAIT